MHAVERVREVDEAALRADRGNGVSERHATLDLLAQEEPDHLALIRRLDLLPGNDEQPAATGALDRLESTPEDVVVGDRDRAEALLLSVVEELLDADRAVVRPARMEVEIGDDPVALFEWRPRRVAAAARGDSLVDLLHPVGEDPGRLRARRREALPSAPREEGFVLDHPSRLGGRELGLFGTSGRGSDRDAGRLRFGDEPWQALDCGDEDRGGAKELGAGNAGARGAHAHPPSQPR